MTHAVTVKCHQAIQLTQLPLMMHSEVSYNSDTELLPPYHHSTIRNQGLGLQAHNGYSGGYNFLFSRFKRHPRTPAQNEDHINCK